ncbi:hypothetical protein ACFS2C_23550 [Prauserella oleivorans]|uniref:DUF4389 domain-containing protein n=1 Tax=Prauserella oleivorans TaxID=1478153 RepID=A0ABW5WFW1_9PSEU
MSTFDVLRTYGTAALLRFAGAVVLFLVLHLVRIPLVLLARVLEVGMRRIDGYAARQASRPPRRPINHFFDPSTSTQEGARVYA